MKMLIDLINRHPFIFVEIICCRATFRCGCHRSVALSSPFPLLIMFHQIAFLSIIFPFLLPNDLSFQLVKSQKHTYRVHFFRKPDGQWLSLLNFHVTFWQNFDLVDSVDVETDNDEREDGRDDPPDYDDEDGWAVIEFENTEKWPKKTEIEKFMDKKDKKENDQIANDGKADERMLPKNDRRPDLALFKDLILPWIPHRLRHHHKPHKFYKGAKPNLGDILIYGGTYTLTAGKENDENIEQSFSKSTEGSDNMTSINSENDSFDAEIANTSLIPPPKEPLENRTLTTIDPINEAELALNLHADPMGRERDQMRQLLQMHESENGTEELVGEMSRDLGGSFILPLLKERKYDNNSIPLVYSDDPLHVSVSLEVVRLGNFDNFQMEYELDLMFRLQWIDVRLSNNFSKPIRLREQKIIDRIWKPDAVFLNSKFSYFHLVSFPNFRMRIMPNGHISYTSRITLLPDCQMNFCNFPHDTQTCTLYISSIAHPESMLEFHWSTIPIGFTRKISLPDLRLKSIANTKCQLPGKLIPSSCLALSFVLRRDSARYVAERYLPSTLAMFFAWVAPFVPYNYEEVRIITPITVLLTLVQMEKGNQEVLTSYLTSLDIWFVVIKAFTVLSLIESLTVMAYIKRGRTVEGQAQRAPNEYHRELLQAEVKRIERIYHRLDHLSRLLCPLAFGFFLLYYAHFIAQSDERMCREQHNIIQ